MMYRLCALLMLLLSCRLVLAETSVPASAATPVTATPAAAPLTPPPADKPDVSDTPTD
ncbi:exported hypothetical protein [mine drainage metagenome]